MKLGQKEKQENVTVMNFLAHHLWPLQKASKLIVQWDEHVRIVTKNKKRQLISLLQKSNVLDIFLEIWNDFQYDKHGFFQIQSLRLQ